MKVNKVNNIFFKGTVSSAKPEVADKERPQITELSNVTPDFAVSLPQKYTKTGIEELSNGLTIHTYKLANGHKVAIVPMEGSPAVVKNYVNVGALNETANIKGISHFLEHMAFNGTNGENGHLKLEVGDSFKKIDELGGWANASTNYAITDYVNSTPLLNKNDLEQQIKVIAAMSEDLKFSEEMIEKEKHPVSSEINMILDDPQTIALDQTVRTLFGIKNPTDEMVGGSVKTIKALTRKDLIDYYNKYYTPDNMNLVITGDVNPDEVIQIIARNFNSKKISQGNKFEEKLNPIDKTIRKDFLNNKAHSAQIVIGFTGPKNNNTREKIICDLAECYLTSYGSGLVSNLKKYNSYPFIDNEKISTNINIPRLNYIGLTCSEENSENALKSVFNTISKIKAPRKEQLEELKQNIIQSKDEALEYSSNVNEIIGRAVLNNNLEYITEYNKILETITPDEVLDGIHKYFNLNRAAVTVIHPQKNESVSFKSTRKPINENNISTSKLPNNYDVGFYNTKNNNITYNISLFANVPYHKKAGVIEVLSQIYSMGMEDMSEDEMDMFQEKNNINLSASLSSSKIDIYTKSSYSKRNLIFDSAKKLLYQPRITEENLQKAKEKIRDYLKRRENTAYNLYVNSEAQNNPYEFTDKEVLENLENITVEDVKECHKYLLENSRGVITANIPTAHKELKDEILVESAELNKVLPNKIELLNVYKENKKPKILQVETNNSQADIMQVYKFKTNDNLKNVLLAELTNSILTSSSIGLFDTLREKDHLAYSVFSDIQRTGNCGEISCNILTTTDNKEINEISYDNVEKSISGFTRQINKLKNGEFTDKDLENAKLSMKAELLNKEGTDKKLSAIRRGLCSKYGINYTNNLYKAIDKIDRDDIVKFANYIFKNPPIYSIAASKDTLENNKEYFKTLEEAV